MSSRQSFKAYYGTSREKAGQILASNCFPELKQGDFHACYQDFPQCRPEDVGLGKMAAAAMAGVTHEDEEVRAIPVCITFGHYLDLIEDDESQRYFSKVYLKMRAAAAESGKAISEDIVMRYIRLEFENIDGFRRHHVLPDDVSNISFQYSPIAYVGVFSRETMSIEENP